LKSLFVQIERVSYKVKKHWIGWVQMHGDNDKKKIPPEVQDFFGKILKILL
jgi:hypothetical protein